MTGPQRHPVELLAQLDAATLGPIAAARARRQLATDPRAAAARAALAATRAELAELAAAPAPELPHDVSVRCAAALAQLPLPGSATSTTGSPAIAPPRWRNPTAAVLAAVAVFAVGAVLGLGWLRGSEVPGPSALPTAPGNSARPALTRDTLASAVRDSLTQRDLGPLSDPRLLAACEAAAGLPTQPLLGGRQVLLDGQPGVLLVLPTGVVGRFRLVVVVPECGTAEGGPILADAVVGR